MKWLNYAWLCFVSSVGAKEASLVSAATLVLGFPPFSFGIKGITTKNKHGLFSAKEREFYR